MAYDLEEQEQLDAFKTWWKANGNMVLAAATAAILAFAGIQGWKYYQHQQSTHWLYGHQSDKFPRPALHTQWQRAERLVCLGWW